MRRRLTPSSVGALLAEVQREAASDGRRWLVCADYISDSVGQALRAADLCYIDTAGNTELRGDGLFVFVRGKARRRPPERPAVRTSALARAAGLQLVYVVLRDPNLVTSTVRDLAARAGLGVGTVSMLLHDLIDEGFVVASGRRRRVTRIDALHQRWLDGYHGVLRPSLAPAPMRWTGGETMAALAERLRDWNRKCTVEQRVVIGGPHIASTWGADLRSEEVTLHSTRASRRALAMALLLRPDPEGTVTLLDAFGRDNTVEPERMEADPLLVEAELLVHAEDRSIAAANDLLKRVIEPRWVGYR